MLIRPICGLFLCLLVVTACMPADGENVSAEHRAAIADSVGRVATAVLDAWRDADSERYIALFSEDVIMAGDRGFIIDDFQEFLETFGGALDSFTQVDGSLDLLNVEVLGRDAAVVVWRMVVNASMGEEDSFDHGVLATAVIARRSGEWKIVRIHESGFPIEEG